MFRLEIADRSNLKDFYKAALNIYRDDDNWIAPLNVEVAQFFNPESNKLIKNGNSRIWVLFENNVPAGRITGFWTESKSKKDLPYAGGIGFFECVDSDEAAIMLFDAAIQWLKGEGMQAVDANTVPGENFNHWGVLIDGFMPQGFGMPYNKPYYRRLFENYGFQVYFEQYSYHMDLTKNLPERHVAFAQHIINSGEYSFKQLDFKQIDKFVDDVTIVFNDVWSAFHAGYVPVERKEFEKMISSLKPIVNPDFIWFVYKDGHPIGMEVCLPDLNRIIKPFKGKLNLINKLRLAFSIKKVDRARVFVFGIHPDYHKTGVTAALFFEMIESLKKAGVKELEMSWVGDYNPTVNKIYKHMINSVLAKTHATFRYMIDKNIEFERFTNIK